MEPALVATQTTHNQPVSVMIFFKAIHKESKRPFFFVFFEIFHNEGIELFLHPRSSYTVYQQ